MKELAVASMLIVAVLVGAGFGYLGGAMVRITELRTTTVTTTSISTMTSVATDSTTSIVTTTSTVFGRPSGPYANTINENSLRMELTLNASSVPSGGTVQILMNLTNVLNSSSVVPTGSSWPVPGLIWPPNICLSYYEFPIGLAIFAGHYVPENLSSARPLYFMKPGTTFCPSTPVISSYDFEPMSNVATFTNVAGSLIRIQASIAVNGSWSGGSPPDFVGAKFSHFSPGIYTVAEGDQWGDILLLYFRVG